MCRPEAICELVFSRAGSECILDSSELFAVAALHWRGQIKHVGVRRDVQEPARDSVQLLRGRSLESMHCEFVRSVHFVCVSPIFLSITST